MQAKESLCFFDKTLTNNQVLCTQKFRLCNYSMMSYESGSSNFHLALRLLKFLISIVQIIENLKSYGISINSFFIFQLN